MKTKRVKAHPTTKVVIHGKEAEIDVDMVKLIQWMNNIEGFHTYYSCQGEEAKKEERFFMEQASLGVGVPYIMFTVDDQSVLNKFVNGLANITRNVPPDKVMFGCEIYEYVLKVEVTPWPALDCDDPCCASIHPSLRYTWRLPSNMFLKELNKYIE